MPKDYSDWKKVFVWLIKAQRVPASDYSEVSVTFYLPYPKNTPKKLLIDNMKHRKRPDLDNFCKGILDVLTDAGVIADDNQVSDLAARKRYTTNPKGRIEIELL